MFRSREQRILSEKNLTQIAKMIAMSVSAFLGMSAHATGYYNFGMQWRGGLNPYQLHATSTFQSGFTSGLTGASVGSGDGSIGTTSWVAVASSGNIYVVDTDNARINKYDSTGVFQGWIGKISISPTGGAAGCAGASVGTFTPGWCKGGESTSGYEDGMLDTPIRIAVDASENIYVADLLNYRINKYNSSGAFQGWIGGIATTPTSGAAGCSSASVGSNTPGWCKGGIAAAGTGDGMFSNPVGVAVDSTGNVYVTDNGTNRVNKFDSTGAFQGWIGKIDTQPTGGAAGCSAAAVGTLTPGWCTGGTSTAGTGDGMFNDSEGVATDSSGNIYVVDLMDGRINKYSSAGVFQGWIGKIGTKPTGGAAGCSTAAVGTLTPGWCTGGASAMSSSEGALSEPDSIALDSSGNLYVSSSNSNRINMYNSSGVYQGWIGKISSSPSGGASGCNGATVGTVTPGWCTGGAATLGSGDGMLNYPTGVAINPTTGELFVSDSANYRINRYTSAGAPSGALQSLLLAYPWSRSNTSLTGGLSDGGIHSAQSMARDSSGNLYVADTNRHRISKYNSAGVFQGWIGKVSSTPSSGAAGCSAAAVGSFTPGWCFGGSSSNGTGDGMLYNPLAIAVDLSGNLYVTDSNNNRVSKYDSTGAFIGWIGKVATTPTGGAGGCSSAAVGTTTPGWCTGGTSDTFQDTSGNGALNYPSGLALDSSGYIYVANPTAGQVTKYNSSGVFQGWIGKVSSTPSSGAAGCSSTAAGSVTPGWCKGGASDTGSGDGMLNSPFAVTIDSGGNLYVAEADNNRISKFNSAGAFQGWTGKILTSPTGGASGCSGASVGTITPGWCKGGTADSGAEDGAMNYPRSIAVDSQGNLYVSDLNNARINKYNSTGVYQGWIGEISSSPTGGATGCNGAAVGTLTPGWCKGGASVSGYQDGSLDGPTGVAVDLFGNLYVADTNNSRVTRYSIQR